MLFSFQYCCRCSCPLSCRPTRVPVENCVCVSCRREKKFARLKPSFAWLLSFLFLLSRLLISWANLFFPSLLPSFSLSAFIQILESVLFQTSSSLNNNNNNSDDEKYPNWTSSFAARINRPPPTLSEGDNPSPCNRSRMKINSQYCRCFCYYYCSCFLWSIVETTILGKRASKHLRWLSLCRRCWCRRRCGRGKS